jgi:hypothetical protein
MKVAMGLNVLYIRSVVRDSPQRTRPRDTKAKKGMAKRIHPTRSLNCETQQNGSRTWVALTRPTFHYTGEVNGGRLCVDHDRILLSGNGVHAIMEIVVGTMPTGLWCEYHMCLYVLTERGHYGISISMLYRTPGGNSKTLLTNILRNEWAWLG